MENMILDQVDIEKIKIATKNINTIIQSNEFDTNLKFELISLAIDIIEKCISS